MLLLCFPLQAHYTAINLSHCFTACILQWIFRIKYSSLKNETSKCYNAFFTKLFCCLSEHVSLCVFKYLINFLFRDLVKILFGADVSTGNFNYFCSSKRCVVHNNFGNEPSVWQYINSDV